MSMALHDNIEKLQAYMARFQSGVLGHFIAGQAAPGESGETFTNITPIDNRAINQVAAGSEVDIDRAARAAADAFPGWREVSGARRREILHAIADGIMAGYDAP